MSLDTRWCQHQNWQGQLTIVDSCTCKHIDPYSPIFYDDNTSITEVVKEKKIDKILKWLNFPSQINRVYSTSSENILLPFLALSKRTKQKIYKQKDT